jgi:D-alanyl-D-alanine-carboxypeptidase/D-alanyl-D-alanine-endopeptidase
MDTLKFTVRLMALGGGLAMVVFLVLLAWVVHKKNRYSALADTHDLKSRIEQKSRPYLVKNPQASLVIGVTRGGRRSISGFGQGGPDGKTLFEIGSVTKVFTGVLLAQAVENGEVALDDPLSKYLSAEKLPPGKPAAKITLVQLATHTSGLPRLPADFSMADLSDPYGKLSVDTLFHSLSETKPGEAGKKSDYSNFGFAVLGQVLARRAGKNYGELVGERVAGPLGMTDTWCELPVELRGRLIKGHDAKGKLVSHWNFDGYAPAGAIRSDASDLLTFLEANLKPADTPLGKALALARREHFSSFGSGVGLAWQRRPAVEGVTLIWHNGGTGGFRSFVGMEEASGTGIVVLSNCSVEVDSLGMELLLLATKISIE